MGIPYAEVIGDPIAHSKSPLIHKFWLEKLGIEGDYRAVRVKREQLSEYLENRRLDPDWRGCNVTMPHKASIIEHLDELTLQAAAVGAVNCIRRDQARLIGTNTDVEGIELVFNSRLWRANQVTLMGGGGAARAALEALRRRDVLEVLMVVRNPEAVRRLHVAKSGCLYSFDELDVAFAGSEYVINATPLGMAGMAEMPASILDQLQAVMGYATVFDMVYDPAETDLLRRARALSLQTIPGIEMLVGQALGSFRCFFGAEPSSEVREALRNRLVS